MDIRVLRYFLKVCELENITKAADALLTTQPNLSRQLTKLEEELGHQLLIRDKRRIRLTEEGRYLRKQALNIVNMADHTEHVLKTFNDNINGDVFIGVAESTVMSFIGPIFQDSWTHYPGIKYHVNSGNYADVTRNLEAGLADFGIVINSTDMDKYKAIKLPTTDTWGILMHKDSPLADKKAIDPSDLEGLPMIASRELADAPLLREWTNGVPINIIATFNLITNAALLINASGGYAFTLKKLTFSSEDNNLVFKPLSPTITSSVYLIWRKYVPLSQSAQVFLELVRKYLSEENR